jgi:hypothetical protein
MCNSIEKSESQTLMAHNYYFCKFVWRFFCSFVRWFSHLLYSCVPYRYQISATNCMSPSDDLEVQILRSSSINSLGGNISFSNNFLTSDSMACCFDSNSSEMLRKQKHQNHEVNKLLRRYSKEAEKEIYLLLLGKYC